MSTEAKIERYLGSENPVICIANNYIALEIENNEVEISCSDSRGLQKIMVIPLKTLKDIITEYYDEISRRKEI